MRNKKFQALLVSLMAMWVCLFFMFLVLFCKTPKEKFKPPNIVFILADDLGYGDLSLLGQKHFQTPNIDRLASEGMLFTQHYSGSTVCAPSRCALLTGQHTGHTFIRGNKEVRPIGQYPLADSIQTMAELFQSKNYTTGLFGKWGLGFPGSEGDPLKQGFDRFYGYNCQRVGHKYYPPHLWDNASKIELKENENQQNKIYGPDLIHQQTLNFISDNKDQPFFLFVASIIPHAELYAPENYVEKYRGKFGVEKPYVGSKADTSIYAIGAYDSQNEPRAHFAGMVNLLDDQVGEIVQKLKEHNLYENTLIVFTSDNGPHQEGGADPDFFNSNQIYKGYKRDLYEGGIRVPMIVHWKNKIEPGRTDHLSAFWDFLPTFADIIDANPKQPIDGISLLPVLMGEKTNQKKHDYLYWEFHERGGRQALRKGDWKLVKLNVKDKTKTSSELYNIKTDPSEENDLADKEREKLEELDSLIRVSHERNVVFDLGL